MTLHVEGVTEREKGISPITWIDGFPSIQATVQLRSVAACGW